MSHPPLPEATSETIYAPGAPGVFERTGAYTADQMHAYADTVLAAARDCRTCRWHNSDDKYWCDMDCTDANRYEPLPPVRLWRKK